MGIFYGMFWLSLVGLIMLPKLGWYQAPENSAMVAYLFMWGLFTAVMFIATLKLNRALQFVFFTLALLFFLLALRDYTGNAVIARHRRMGRHCLRTLCYLYWPCAGTQ